MVTWLMPAESEPHERTWMAWPSGGYTLGDTRASAEEAWTAWAAVANAVAEHEPLTMLATPATLDEARRRLAASVTLLPCALDDAWYRDTGPTFVLDADGRLGAVNWTFNGWGAQDWASWEADAEAGGAATTATTAVRIDSQLVNEGGGIHTDGAGTFLVTTTVQLDPGRNPGWTAPGVEAELARTVGATKVIWLPRGLTRDSETYGTRGHVDLLAAFSAPGRVLVHDQRDPSHPDHAISRDLIARLSAETDASGRALEVTALPAPATLRDRDGYVDYSYVNHYVLNGAVVAGVFDDPNDAAALAVLADAYPGREVVAVDARPLFARGGGVHCITQQQPRSRVEEKP